jgi:hypothetical protein
MCLFTMALRASVNKSHIPSLPQNNLYVSAIFRSFLAHGLQTTCNDDAHFQQMSKLANHTDCLRLQIYLSK